MMLQFIGDLLVCSEPPSLGLSCKGRGYQSRLFALAALACLLVVPARAEVEFEASWELPTYEHVRGQMLAWLEESKLDEKTAFVARSYWPEANLRASDGATLLDRSVETFALVEPRAKRLMDACNAEYTGPLPPSAAWLEDSKLPATLRNNLRLYYGRWLAQHKLYDEVLATLSGVKPNEVFDPAGLLFYQMIAHHQVVEPEKSRLMLVQLMEQEEQLPHRYLQVAQLLRRDLESLKDESLDHIARRMNDVRRRLEIGRAGKQVQVVEKGVVNSLDKIIKKIEEKQQQQSSQAPGAQQSSKPMEESKLPSLRAPMKVDKKNIGNQSGWGDLPPKEREKSLQQLGREYPAHYRELIEQYFRELADETNNNSAK